MVLQNKKKIFSEINIVMQRRLQKIFKKINKNLPTFFVHFDHKPNIRVPYIGICGGGLEKRKYISWQIKKDSKIKFIQ